jgi:hypothetical protein
MTVTLENMDSIMDNLNNARLAVERAQEDRTGYTEAQQHVKQAEEMLSQARRNPQFNNQANEKEMQRATDLLRLIEETNQAINRNS